MGSRKGNGGIIYKSLIMTKIQTTAYLKIHPGKQEAFDALANNCIEAVKEKDKGTLQYDWFYSEDNVTCVVREHYESSAALMEHMANVGEHLGPMLIISHLSLEVFGNPSTELLAALEGLDVKYYTFKAGL